MKLKVLSQYRSAKVAYEADQLLDLKDEEAAFLMRDAPGCFKVYVPRKRRGRPPKRRLPVENAMIEEPGVVTK